MNRTWGNEYDAVPETALYGWSHCQNHNELEAIHMIGSLMNGRRDTPISSQQEISAR